MRDVLQTDNNGLPQSWISYSVAAALITSGQVSWSKGPIIATLRGGHERKVDIPAIVATTKTSRRDLADFTPFLGARNDKLFARDRMTCAYCGDKFTYKMLSRDHIFPRSRGGEDTWMNVVTACKPCNNKKDSKTPEEAGMTLLYQPYIPNYFEDLYLSRGDKFIIHDQMDFIAGLLPKNSRIRSQTEVTH